ncbi:hypothetical protein WJX72_009381 [[Myrmecia] bisecta]|uniref:Peroxisomal membrane protein 11A n=1 Tax=[Myrmecia] bisecta TaxID=41462 RepID=A0AAW1P3Q1_9CHLO
MGNHRHVKQPDTLDLVVAFLAKRDGIDKVLKIIRYLTKLILALELTPEADLAKRLSSFESSIGVSRKAYRLGKWLANLNAIRKTPITTRYGALELLNNGGEGVYYFVEQLTWLVKAGLIDKRFAKRFSRISAWGEMVGYVGNITLNCLRIAAALEREVMLTEELHRRKKMDDQAAEGDAALMAEVRALQARRLLRTLAVVQDLCDSTLALNDIRETKGIFATPTWLGIAGLISAFISVHKNWPPS